jgi:hypothetical protein
VNIFRLDLQCLSIFYAAFFWIENKVEMYDRIRAPHGSHAN